MAGRLLTTGVVALGVAAIVGAACVPGVASAQGGLDPSFGDDGLAEPIKDAVVINGMLEIHDDGPHAGQIVVGGYLKAPGRPGFLARLDSDGSLDELFGDGGVVELANSRFGRPSAIALYADGSVAYALSRRAEIGRVLPDGTPDKGFGRVDISNRRSTEIRDLEVEAASQDLIVPLGVERYAGLGHYVGLVADIHRFNEDGSPDAEWAGGKPAPIEFRAGDTPILEDIEIAADGSVWVAGRARVNPGDPGIQRLTGSGAPASELTPGTEAGATFGLPAGGRVFVKLEPGTSSPPLLASGAEMARVADDGTLIPGTVTGTDPGGVGGFVQDLELDPAGRVTTLFSTVNDDFVVSRIQPQGGVDPSFGFGGATPIRWPGSFASMPGLALWGSTQVVAGYAARIPAIHSRQVAALARLSDANDPSGAAPETSVISGPSEGSTTRDPTPTFGFASSEPRSSFECTVESRSGVQRTEACENPYTLDRQPNDSITLQVRAVSIYGVEDETRAVRAFRVDAAPPDTFIDSGPDAGSLVRRTSVEFGFSSPQAHAEFRCSLDGAKFTFCTNPRRLKNLEDGGHTFRVRAIDEGGRHDRTPAKRRFRVKVPPPRCDFPQLRSPATLRAVRRKGVHAEVLCADEAKAEVELRVTDAAAAAFGLDSRVIGVGNGRLKPDIRKTVTAGLRESVARRLGRFDGATVYFQARVVPANPGGGAEGRPLIRYGQFTVER